MPHTPSARPKLVVSADGSLVAIAEPERVVVVELPDCELLSEVGVSADAEHELAWLGTPPRLLILSRFAAHTTVHFLDPHGPQSIAEIELASAVGLFGAVGAHALVIGAQGAAILGAGDAHLTPYQFPARAKPTVAGAAGSQFVVAIPGTIEEWDPVARVPKRRLRLPRPTTITSVGGSERVVWMVTQQDPHRIDVLPLINRGQPKLHDLPEAIASISGHPKSDLLVAVGASGRAYAIDLDGRTRLRALAFEGIDHVETIGLVVGRSAGAVAAQHGRPLAFLPLETKDAIMGQSSSMVVPTRFDEPAPEPVPDEPSSTPPRTSSLVGSLVDAAMSLASKVSAPASAAAPAPPASNAPASRAATPTVPATPAARAAPTAPGGAPAAAAPKAATKTAKNLAARFAAVREQREQALVGTPAATDAAPAPNPIANPSQVPMSISSPVLMSISNPLSKSGPATGATPVRTSSVAIALDIQPRSWRDDLVQWARDVLALRGDAVPMPPPAAASLDELGARFELSIAIGPALALLYGAHLAGHDGVAPADLSRVLDRSWDEALGRGELAATGIARYERSRVRFASAVQRVLDELPPATGTLVGVPGTVALLGPCVLVDHGDALDIAASHAPRAGGAILVGNSDRVDEICFEARALGAVAMLPASKYDGDQRSVVIYVADDDADADRLGLPRLG